MKFLFIAIAFSALSANAQERSCPSEIIFKVSQLKEAQGLDLSAPIPAAKAANGHDVFLVKGDQNAGAPVHRVFQVETRRAIGTCVVVDIKKISDVE